MKKVAIVYHSGFGHTAVQAKAVLAGASTVDGVEAALFEAESITDDPSVLNDYGAIIMGSPTYMGSLSAKFKAFMEATSKLWYERKWKDKLAAGFTNSHSLSGDKLNALMQLVVFAMQHGMLWVGQGEMNGSPDGEPGKADVVNRIGASLGAMAQSENDDPSVTPPEGDIQTAYLLGERVAKLL